MVRRRGQTQSGEGCGRTGGDVGPGAARGPFRRPHSPLGGCQAESWGSESGRVLAGLAAQPLCGFGTSRVWFIWVLGALQVSGPWPGVFLLTVTLRAERKAELYRPSCAHRRRSAAVAREAERVPGCYRKVGCPP